MCQSGAINHSRSCHLIETSLLEKDLVLNFGWTDSLLLGYLVLSLQLLSKIDGV